MARPSPWAPSCIICKYCEVTPPPSRARGEGSACPPSQGPPPSVPASDTGTVSLQAASVAEAGPVLSGPGGQGLGPAHPENPVWGQGAREEEGSPGVPAGKELALQRPPLPLPGSGLRVSALSPPEWAWGGALGKGRTQGKAKGFSGNPHILTEVSHQDGPVARAPAEERGSGPDGDRLVWPAEAPRPSVSSPRPEAGDRRPLLPSPHLRPFGELIVCVRCLTY